MAHGAPILVASGACALRRAPTRFGRVAALLGFVLCFDLAACASPAPRFDRAAAELGFGRRQVLGERFVHAVYAGPSVRAGQDDGPLHVYLGSDGTPSLAGRPAADPTPRNPLALRLMALDPAPAVYIGRPCYHGSARDAGCSIDLWTTARYADRVLASMAAATREVLASTGFDRVIWFGYSGGGVLAMLLAERFPRTEAVVTVAANLDTDAWADHHGYGRLTGSLNPARIPPLPPRIRQIHYAGSDDRIVPPAIVLAAVRRLGGAFVVYEGFNHVCCWEAIWPQILADVTDDGPEQSTGKD